jgi:hypothetical protein
MPICVAESMTCGVPCAVTDVSDLRLVVRDPGFRSTEGSQGACQGTSYLANRIFQEPELAYCPALACQRL